MRNDLHALLIGIDSYPNAPDQSLAGAVADVEAMHQFLLRRQVPPEAIRRLLSPLPSAAATCGDGLPTYDRIVHEIRDLGQRAAASRSGGGKVLLCYSGHGGRVATLLPGRKGTEGLDEALVPCDLGAPGSRWLRDVELTYLLDEMLQQGLRVTVILDACHSGGMFRGDARRSRRRRLTAEGLEPEAASQVASLQELEATWRRIHPFEVAHQPPLHDEFAVPAWSAGPLEPPKRVLRHADAPASGWIAPAVLRQGGLTLLAACSPWQVAMEHELGGQVRGALTYSLLQILQSPGAETASWHRVHLQLKESLRRLKSAELPLQTPFLEGDTSQLWLTADVAAAQSIAVTAVASNHLSLGAGRAWGIGPGALFELSSTDLHPLWRLRVEAASADESLAVLLDAGGDLDCVKVGEEARCLTPGDGAGTSVLLVPEGDRDRGGGERVLRDGSLRAAPSAQVLGWLRQGLEKPPASLLGGGFLQPMTAQDGATDKLEAAWQVRIRDGRCRICHWDGTPLAVLPEIPVLQAEETLAVVEPLAHLARFEHLRGLSNDDDASTLASTVALQVALLPEGWAEGDRMDPSPLADIPPQIPAGRWIALGIESTSHRGLYLQVMALRWDWSVAQLYPQGNGQLLVEGPGQTWLPLEIKASPGGGGGRELLKVIATNEPMALGQWTLPPLAEPRRARRRRGRTRRGGGLQRGGKAELMAGSDTRFTHAAHHWTTAELEIEVLVDP